jgi:hypothetical protein
MKISIFPLLAINASLDGLAGELWVCFKILNNRNNRKALNNR